MSTTISITGLNAIAWTLTGVTTILVGGRLAIRYRVRRRFFWDDFFQVIALIGVYIWSGGCSAIYDPVDTLFAAERGKTAKPPNYNEIFVYYRKLQTLVTIGFWISVFSVKFSFLYFYRLLFSISPKFLRAWWTVTIFTVVAFWVCIAGELTKCGPTSQIFSPVACSSPAYSQYQKQVEEYSCGVQVGTDLMIMALPLGVLSHLQIKLSQKIGLACIFCIAFVTIALDILRMYESIGAGGVFSYSVLYGTLEVTFGTMIACAPTYRGLLGIQRRIHGGQYVDMGLPTKDDGSVELITHHHKASIVNGTRIDHSSHNDEAGFTDDGSFGKYVSRTLPTARDLYEAPSARVDEVQGLCIS